MGDRKSRTARRVPDPLTVRRVQWRAEPDETTFTAAMSYLTLLFEDDTAAIIVERFRDQGDSYRRRPLDLLRAAGLPLLGRDDPHVTGELVRIAGGKRLSPALYLRGTHRRDPIVVDGYPRICASYHCDPNADVHVRLV